VDSIGRERLKRQDSGLRRNDANGPCIAVRGLKLTALGPSPIAPANVVHPSQAIYKGLSLLDQSIPEWMNDLHHVFYRFSSTVAPPPFPAF